MKKDKDWLSEQVGDLNSTDAVFNESGVSYIDTAVSIERVYDLIYQLDEPEVLSQEWIDEHEEQEEMYGTYGVPVHKLQNLLVPTLSEMEKVQLSQKTADELNRYKELGYSLKDLLVIASSKQAQEKLARAWLDGYKVEEEQKYYVLDKEDATLLKKSAAGEGVAKSVGTNIYNVKSWKDEEKYQLTKQEIKDYDERFWAFAVPVEEME